MKKITIEVSNKSWKEIDRAAKGIGLSAESYVAVCSIAEAREQRQPNLFTTGGKESRRRIAEQMGADTIDS